MQGAFVFNSLLTVVGRVHTARDLLQNLAPIDGSDFIFDLSPLCLQFWVYWGMFSLVAVVMNV